MARYAMLQATVGPHTLDAARALPLIVATFASTIDTGRPPVTLGPSGALSCATHLS
jgi:hypothetical protein